MTKVLFISKIEYSGSRNKRRHRPHHKPSVARMFKSPPRHKGSLSGKRKESRVSPRTKRRGDALANSDVFLVKLTGKHSGMPLSLLSFLEKEGFHVVYFSPVPSPSPMDGRRTLYSITNGNRERIADVLLAALSVSFEKERDIALDDGSLSGISFSVRADRHYPSSRSPSRKGRIISGTLASPRLTCSFPVLSLDVEDAKVIPFC